MSGVYLKETLYCRRCGKQTPHHVGWEAEESDSLEEECLSCGRHEIVDGDGRRVNVVDVKVGGG